MSSWLRRAVKGLAPPVLVELARLVRGGSGQSAAMLARFRESDRNVRGDSYIEWICRIVGGWLRPQDGNIRAFDYAVRQMPAQGAVVEIGSFLGLSACILCYLMDKYDKDNVFFASDPWDFEGTEELIGGYFDASTPEYREYAKRVPTENLKTFGGSREVHPVELHSGPFFQSWAENREVEDIFRRPVALGGPISFAYIDGAHAYEAVRQDFANVDRFLAPGGFVLFDDSSVHGGSPGVARVATEVASLPGYDTAMRTPNRLFCKT